MTSLEKIKFSREKKEDLEEVDWKNQNLDYD